MTTQRFSVSWKDWGVLFLVPPSIWYGYFWVVYLFAEAGCSDASAGTRPLADNVVTYLTLALTVLTITAIGFVTFRAYQRIRSGRDRSDVFPATLGAILGGFFIVATLFVGGPAIWLAPC